jgi:hypothetical protein
MTLKKIRAISVSALLRRNGMLPVPTYRDGLHVKRGYNAYTIHVAGSVCDSEKQSLKLADQAAEILLANGYTVSRDMSPTHLRVTKSI